MPEWFLIALAAILGLIAISWLDHRSGRGPVRRRKREPSSDSSEFQIDLNLQGGRRRDAGSDTGQPGFWGRLFGGSDGDGGGGDGGGGD